MGTLVLPSRDSTSVPDGPPWGISRYVLGLAALSSVLSSTRWWEGPWMGKIGANSESVRAADVHSLGSCGSSPGASPSAITEKGPSDSHVHLALAEPDCRGLDLHTFKLWLFIKATSLFQQVPSLLSVSVDGRGRQPQRRLFRRTVRHSRKAALLPDGLPEEGTCRKPTLTVPGAVARCSEGGL